MPAAPMPLPAAKRAGSSAPQTRGCRSVARGLSRAAGESQVQRMAAQRRHPGFDAGQQPVLAIDAGGINRPRLIAHRCGLAAASWRPRSHRIIAV
jgi:hypothetical protein